MIIKDQFSTIKNLQCRGPLFPKPVTGQELFFAVSYSKLALVLYNIWIQPNNMKYPYFKTATKITYFVIWVVAVVQWCG